MQCGEFCKKSEKLTELGRRVILNLSKILGIKRFIPESPFICMCTKMIGYATHRFKVFEGIMELYSKFPKRALNDIRALAVGYHSCAVYVLRIYGTRIKYRRNYDDIFR